MNKRRSLLLSASFITTSAIALVFSLSGCSKDDPEPVNENELITTLTLSFQKLNGDGSPASEAPAKFSWKDEDGPGSMAPTIDEIVLDANTTYALTLEILDESKVPVEDIAAEIEEEDEDHQFFYSWDGIFAELAYDDQDSAGKPVGLKNIFTAGDASTGSLVVKLIHEPDKDAAGVQDGNPANAGGETDLDAEFPVTIQ